MLIASNAHIEEAFKSVQQSIMTIIKNCGSEDWIVNETIAYFISSIKIVLRF